MVYRGEKNTSHIPYGDELFEEHSSDTRCGTTLVIHFSTYLYNILQYNSRPPPCEARMAAVRVAHIDPSATLSQPRLLPRLLLVGHFFRVLPSDYGSCRMSINRDHGSPIARGHFQLLKIGF